MLLFTGGARMLCVVVVVSLATPSVLGYEDCRTMHRTSHQSQILIWYAHVPPPTHQATAALAVAAYS